MEHASISISHISPRTQPDQRITPAPVTTHELLIVEEEPIASLHAHMLRATYRVATTANSDVAVQYVTKGAPTMVVLDLDAVGDGATAICRAAKAAALPPTTLVIASQADAVPAVLRAGCDAVLLKPFAPNLLYTRLGRLLRTRTDGLRARARASGRTDGSGPLATTNRVWPETTCPTCDRPGAVSFEFSSHRRAWYACVGCMAVWVGKRQE